MTPKEKAEELVLKYLRIKDNWNKDGWFHKGLAKQCALIAVDEMIYYLPSVDVYPYFAQKLSPGVKEYWEEVKQEIEKL